MSKNTVILDARGLVIHSLNSGKDSDPSHDSEGKEINTELHAMEFWYERYLTPTLTLVAPTDNIAVWDDGDSFHRQALLPTYKANRKNRKSDPLVSAETDKAMELCKDLLKSLGCIQVSAKNVEADDIIALLVEKLPGNKVVRTVDADLLQLTDESTVVFLKDDLIMKSHKGIPLNLTTLNKSLVGDSSDNYKGVDGLGPVKWDDMVSLFGFDGMEELEQCVINKNYSLIEQAYSQSNCKGLELILKDTSAWELMYSVARLSPEVCTQSQNGKLSKLKWVKRLPQAEFLEEALAACELLDVYKDLVKYCATETLVTSADTSKIKELVHALNNTPFTPMDYETTDKLNHQPYNEANPRGDYVDVINSSLTGASFTYGDNLQHTIYIPVDHKDTDNIDKDMLAWLVQKVDDESQILVHNAQFEQTLTENDLGLNLQPMFDTVIFSSHADENLEPGLKGLSKHYLRYSQTTYSEVMGDKQGMNELTGEEVLHYGCDDSICTGHLFELFYVICHVEGTYDFIVENEFKATEEFRRLFTGGMVIDSDCMTELSKVDAKTVEEGTKTIRKLLQENCSKKYNLEGSTTLFNDLSTLTVSKGRTIDKKSEEDIQKDRDNLWQNIYAGSKYVPYTEIRKTVDFKPTNKQLTSVASQLGFKHEIMGVTSNKLTEWLAEETASTEGQQTFVHLLLECIPHEVKKRQGDNYQNLLKFCTEVVSRDAVVEATGDELNFGSPVQMQSLLYAKLGLPIRVRSKVGKGSVRDQLGLQGSPSVNDKAVATALAQDLQDKDWRYEIVSLMSGIKAAITRNSLYYSKYPLWADPTVDMPEGKYLIHPQIRNCGTVTRRPTGTAPNILQVAKRGEVKVRKAFLPAEPGHIIIDPDFSGQELRIMTSESECPVLLDAYIGENKKDIHSVTGAGIASIIVPRIAPDILSNSEVELTNMGMDYDKFVSLLKGSGSDMAAEAMDIIRFMSKAVNFLIIYGGGPTTLSTNLGIPVEMAEAIMTQVFKKYPGLLPWQERVKRFAKQNGYVLTAYGSRRHIGSDINSTDSFLRSRMERQAMNAPIQGGAADILKVVLAKCYDTNLFKRYGAKLIAPIYDELGASVPKEAAVEYTQELISYMEVTPPGHKVPMVAEVAIGNNWADLTEIGDHPTKEAIEAELRA